MPACRSPCSTCITRHWWPTRWARYRRCIGTSTSHSGTITSPPSAATRMSAHAVATDLAHIASKTMAWTAHSNGKSSDPTSRGSGSRERMPESAATRRSRASPTHRWPQQLAAPYRLQPPLSSHVIARSQATKQSRQEYALLPGLLPQLTLLLPEPLVGLQLGVRIRDPNVLEQERVQPGDPLPRLMAPPRSPHLIPQ